MEALGIQFSEGHIGCALVTQEQGQIKISFTKTLPLTENVKPLYTLSDKKGGSFPSCATALSAHEVLFRKIHLPIKERSKALKALPFQLESLLPIPLSEMIVSLVLKKVPSKTFDALVFCAKETSLKNHLESLELDEIDSDFVTLEPIALYRLARYLYGQEKELCIFLFREDTGLCVFLSQGEIALTHTSSDLTRLKIFLESKGLWTEEIPALLLGASPENLLAWKEIFSDKILPVSEEVSSYAIAIGLALSSLAHDDYRLNLREEKWACPKSLQKRKKAILFFSSLCLGALSLLSIASHVFFKFQYEKLQDTVRAYLPQTFSEMNLSSPEEIRKALTTWEKTVGVQKLPFPFLPTLPSAADVLAWLSTHPSLSTKEGLPKEGISIQAVRYHLYQYPKLGTGKEPYLAKVEIEFIAQTPKLAREFHDALLAGDRIVNAKKEITWNVQQSTYFTAFEVNSLPQGPSR